MKFGQAPVSLAPESAYNNANNELAAKIERLEDLVSNLRHRLTPVLAPGGLGKAADCGAQSSISAVPAPLVAALEGHAAKADYLGDELNEILSRICL